MKRLATHVTSLVAVATILAASTTATAQIAGAPPPETPAANNAAPSPAPAPLPKQAPKPALHKPAPAPKPALLGSAPPAAMNTNASTSAAPFTAMSLEPLASGSAQAPGQAQAPAPAASVNVVTVGASAAPAASMPAAAAVCVPECRNGFVCREGECVSACNPGCAENEVCNAKRECVPRTESNDPYAYDKTRFGLGGHAGIASAADGTGTPFGGHVAISLPLGGHFYTREDLVFSYFRTTTNDQQYIGASVSPIGTTPVDQTYLLVALRATAGFQLAPAFSARAGAILGSHTLETSHGMCGNGPQDRSDTSFAVGGTGALAFSLKHADLSLVVDAYSANTQQLCSVVVGPFNVPHGAQMVPQKQFAAQFLAQGTILF